MTAPAGSLSGEAAIRHALRGVIDPEIGLSVVDVGLIYGIRIDDDGRAVIEMTTTSRGCPAAQYLLDAVRERALDTGVSNDVDVRLTYDPPWSPDMMSA
jgi:metal-sulfur cluster biosynthetic enzyme